MSAGIRSVSGARESCGRRGCFPSRFGFVTWGILVVSLVGFGIMMLLAGLRTHVVAGVGICYERRCSFRTVTLMLRQYGS